MFHGFSTCLLEEADAIPAIKTYVISDQVRHIIESKQFADPATNPAFSPRGFLVGKLPDHYSVALQSGN